MQYNAGLLILGVISFSIGCAFTSKPQMKIIKPIGPKLCKNICSCTVGCPKYAYRIDNLSCYLTDTNSTIQELGQRKYIVKTVKISPRMNGRKGLKQCERNDIIFLTRKKTHICRHQGLNKDKKTEDKKTGDKKKGGNKITEDKETEDKNIEEKKMTDDKLKTEQMKTQSSQKEEPTRLLLLPFGFGRVKSDPLQLFLNNMSLAPYPYLSREHFSAVAYISTSKKLVIATANPYQLYFVRLNSNNKKFVKCRLSISGITVDEFKQLLFVTTSNPYDKLYVMTTGGKKNKCVCKLTWKADDIAADPSSSHIYIMYPDMIHKITYSGKFVHAVVEEKVNGFMSVDLGRNILYFMAGKPSVVRQVSVEDESVVKTTPTGLAASRFYVAGGNFYVVPERFTGDIFKISENEGTSKIKTNYVKHKVTIVQLCGLP